MSDQLTISKSAISALMIVVDAGLRRDSAGFDAAIARMKLAMSDEISERIETILMGHLIRKSSCGDGEGERAARMDIVVLLHKLGTINDDHLIASADIRRFYQMCQKSGGVGAVDPAKPVIDATPWKWSIPENCREIDYRLADRCSAWLKKVIKLEPLRGSRSTMSAAELVRSVVINNSPLAEIDRQMKCRKGSAKDLLIKALSEFPI